MLNVAVGVILNNHGDVLISQRAKNAEQGGLWEFPGGKLEIGENTYQALKRELLEELGIRIKSTRPLIKVNHQYSDFNVSLDVLTVELYEGEANGLEGQPIKWVQIEELKNYSFPAANSPIITALQLPNCYPIVDSSMGTPEQMLEQLQYLIIRGFSVIQFRAKGLSETVFNELAIKAVKLSETKNVRLYLNSSVQKAIKLGATGVHISSQQAAKLGEHKGERIISIAVSCHTKDDIINAKRIGADFSVLSPVCMTTSHPSAIPIGWKRFKELVEGVGLPVYALGGLNEADIGIAKEHAGQGISGIRSFVN
jgi:8-oxo-dGTP diphosphatase